MGNHTTQNSTLGHTPFETVAEEVFRRYGRAWKPRVAQVDRAYLRCQILPATAGNDSVTDSRNRWNVREGEGSNAGLDPVSWTG